MKRWMLRTLLALLILGVGYVGYDAYRAGLHTRPKLPPGAFSISYKSGLRAILIDVPNEQDERRYLGFPIEVPYYLKDTWSFCTAASEDEAAQIAAILNNRNWPGERIEAVCRIKVEDQTVIRGYITSVPKIN